MQTILSTVPAFAGRPQSMAFTPGFVATCLLLASIPFENTAVLPGIGSITRLVGVIATLLVLFESFITQRFRHFHAVHTPMVLFILWSSWSMAWSFDPVATQSRFVTNVQLLMLAWMVWQVARDASYVRWLLQAYVAGTTGAALSAIFSQESAVVVDNIRTAVGGADPNDAGLMMVMSLPIAYFLARRTSQRLMVLLWAGCCVIVLVGIVKTVSRGALIATAVALAGIALTYLRTSSGIRLAPIVGCLFLLGLGSLFIPDAVMQRFKTIPNEIAGGGVGKRTPIWKAGLELWQERPLTGLGSGTYGYATEPLLGRNLVAHNTFISVLVETGITGFALLVLVLGMLAMVAFTLPEPQRMMWLTVLAVWCIGVLSLTYEAKKVTWCLFGMLVASGGVSYRGRAEQQ